MQVELSDDIYMVTAEWLSKPVYGCTWEEAYWKAVLILRRMK